MIWPLSWAGSPLHGCQATSGSSTTSHGSWDSARCAIASKLRMWKGLFICIRSLFVPLGRRMCNAASWLDKWSVVRPFTRQRTPLDGTQPLPIHPLHTA